MKKIMILDDNPLMQEQIAAVIRQLPVKCELFSMTNLKDAYQCAIEKQMDLFIVDVILDPDMPGDASGLKFTSHLRQIESYAFTPVILVTSLADTKLYAYEKLHCYSFIEKPFSPEKLKAQVEQCLRFPSFKREVKTLYFRKEGVILSVEADRIVYAEFIRHTMHLHTCDEDMLTVPYITIKKLLEEADFPNLIQCSRNLVVNKSFVLNADLGNGLIQLKEDRGILRIGNTFKNKLRETLK